MHMDVGKSKSVVSIVTGNRHVLLEMLDCWEEEGVVRIQSGWHVYVQRRVLAVGAKRSLKAGSITTLYFITGIIFLALYLENEA